MSQKKTSIDPARSLNLLWGSHTVPGRSGLTIKKIVAAGLELARLEGLQELSMRKVAGRIGVGTMSLYTHIKSKNELIELMHDYTYKSLYDEEATTFITSSDWRSALSFIARKNWDMFLQHPWLHDLEGKRPVLGPHTTMKYDAELRALEGIGLTDLEMDASLSLVLNHVESCARLASNIDNEKMETGIDDKEWWLAYAPTLERLVDPSKFPLASRVGEAAGQAHQSAYSAEHAYQFGLERILDGIGMLIESRE